jgi:uncharacterized protein (TIGR03437 family)
LLSTAFAQPAITGLANNYSYIQPGMPNYGIALGSIFDIFGTSLAGTTTPLQQVPLPASLSGVTISVTVNGAATHLIIYYLSLTQIVAILPSATPVGTGQITVADGSQTSAPASIQVVQSAFGLLTANGAGSGPAAAFDASNGMASLDSNSAANPGDAILLWGSGLGPVTGDDTQPQTPQNLTNIPVEVDIGGVAASGPEGSGTCHACKTAATASARARS